MDENDYPVALHLAAPLHTAAYYGNADDVRTLLAEGALIDEVSYWGNTALEIAIIQGHEEIALQLIEGGANVWEATDSVYHQWQKEHSYTHDAQPIHVASGY